MKWFWPVLAVVASIAAGGCRRSRAPVEPAPAPPRLAHMHEVLRAANAAREAVIAGDSRSARTRLAWLADQAITEGPLPAAWVPMAEEVRQRASQAAEGETVLEVSRGLAAMAVACGRCHQAADTGPLFAYEELPAGETVPEHMARHRWAVDSMWEGLVTGDDHRWRSGVTRFLEAPLVPVDSDPLPEGAASWLARVHELGVDGSATIAEPDQAELLGELMATCALCHQASGDGPG